MAVRIAFIALLAVSGGNVAAQPSVDINGPWVRETVAAQTSTGGYMEITSRPGGVLIGASSPVAGRVEVHRMTLEGNTMKMRAVDKLDLPAGKTVKLAPGGYHLMLLDLKQALPAGILVPLKLSIVGNDGRRSSVEIKAEVRPLGGIHQH